MLRFGLGHVLGSALILVAVAACGDDDDDGGERDGGGDGGERDGGSGMDGSVAGSGGGGRGGMGGVGGVGGTPADAGDPYTCEPPPPEEGGNAEAGEPCCGGLGRCTANVSGAGTEAYGLDECSAEADLKCVPLQVEASQDAGAEEDAGSGPQLATCRAMLPNTSGADLEGRCIPGCFLLGARNTANLGQSTCADGERCVPCYSPITGMSTGACSRAGDAPTDPAPAGYAECGEGNIGFCVPSTGGMASGVMLPQLTCADGQVCAPKLRVLDRTACFARCSALGMPGACVAKFIIPAMYQSLLPMDTCAVGEICAPCISPLNGMPTNACR